MELTLSEKQYSRDEAIDALLLAANNKADTTSEDFVSETELLQVAKEMGVDTDRLREVLSQGTGTIQSKDKVRGGIGWPGNEEFVRTLSGELSDEGIQEIADALGTPMTEKPSVAGSAHSESWIGFLYRTTTVVKRGRRTKITMRLRPSFNRIMPLAMILIFFNIVPVVNLTSTKLSAQVAIWFAVGFAVGLAVIWALLGVSMRKSRDAAIKLLDETAELAKGEIISRNNANTTFLTSSNLVAPDEEIQDDLRT